MQKAPLNEAGEYGSVAKSRSNIFYSGKIVLELGKCGNAQNVENILC